MEKQSVLKEIVVLVHLVYIYINIYNKPLNRLKMQKKKK